MNFRNSPHSFREAIFFGGDSGSIFSGHLVDKVVYSKVMEGGDGAATSSRAIHRPPKKSKKLCPEIAGLHQGFMQGKNTVSSKDLLHFVPVGYFRFGVFYVYPAIVSTFTLVKAVINHRCPDMGCTRCNDASNASLRNFRRHDRYPGPHQRSCYHVPTLS